MRCFLCAALVLLAGCGKQPVRQDLRLPSLMIWAWDRPEDLKFIDVKSTGVAYLAGTVDILRDGTIHVQMRRSTLRVPPSTAILPVIRIQSRGPHAPADADTLASVVHRAGGPAVQIDFDARQSEYPLYRDILTRLAAQPVSITALASWCGPAWWMDARQVNEVVPMLFRMGHFVRVDRVRLDSSVCSSSVGLSMDEPWPLHRNPDLRRIYVFNPNAWTAESYRQLQVRVQQWK